MTIPNSVTSIGVGAFGGCISLTSVTIPNSVTSIGDGAFSGCSGLTSVTIPNSITSIGNDAFRDCSGLTSVTIPNSVTSIDHKAFANCSSLTSITIPNSITSIGINAFDGCRSLTSVTIPNSVKSIGYQAFAGCPELTDVYCYAENIPGSIIIPGNPNQSNLDMFQDSYIELATLHVPAASFDAYKSTAPWSGFGTIVPLTQEEIDNYNESTDIHSIVTSKDVQQIHTIDGKPAKTLQKGVNIIRASDGTTKKVFVK